MLINISMHQPETNFCYVADKSCPLDTFFCLFSSTPTATTFPRSAATVDPVDSRDWEACFPPVWWWYQHYASSCVEGSAGHRRWGIGWPVEGPSIARTWSKGWNFCQASGWGVFHMLYSMWYYMLYHMLWVCSLAFCPRWTGKRQVFYLEMWTDLPGYISMQYVMLCHTVLLTC